jgi:hypothetical protein
MVVGEKLTSCSSSSCATGRSLEKPATTPTRLRGVGVAGGMVRVDGALGDARKLRGIPLLGTSVNKPKMPLASRLQL